MSQPKNLPSHIQPSDADALIERATRQPGVADLLRLYQQHAETMRQAEPFVRRQTKLTIFSTGNATA